MTTFRKDPDERLDYSVDWSDWLDEGDSIVLGESGSVWTVPVGITADGESVDGAVARLWLKEGTAGVTYPCVNHIVTVMGREGERTIRIRVGDR